jgi:hypothetical protein
MSLEVPLTLDAGHRGTMIASAAESRGWDVRIDVDGVTVLRSHVNDWHRVERLRARVEAAHHVASRAQGEATQTAGAGRG